MSKKDKLKEILRVMNGESIDFTPFDTAVKELRKSLEEKVAIPTIERVGAELEAFKKKLDITPLLTSLDEVKKSVNTKLTELSTRLEGKIKEQETNESEARTELDSNFNKQLSTEINALRVQIAGLDTVSSGELTRVEKEIKDLAEKTKKAIEEIPDREKEIKDLEKLLEKLRIDTLNRLSQIGGGNMNRQIYIGGADFLKKYTDYNIKAGSNITITYVDNNTTKKVDVTFSSSGGGGGSVRSISSISTDTTAGATAGTDYVYLISGTTTLTLPTAVGNSNLYTIKNVGTGVVTIATTSAQTIDGSGTIVMPVQFTAVDLISDTANWNVT